MALVADFAAKRKWQPAFELPFARANALGSHVARCHTSRECGSEVKLKIYALHESRYTLVG